MSGGGPDPSSYQLPGFKEEGSKAMGDINTLYSQMQGLGGQYAPITAQLGANPYAAASQAGANTASTMGMGQGTAAVDAASGIYGQINGAQPYGQEILQTAFDPQNALYARTLQQMQDSERAGESMRGIAMSPYGQGLENDATRNFNIDWQNNALQRQATGLGAWTNFMQGQGGAANTAAGLGRAGTGLYQESSAMPYNTYSGIKQGQLGALDKQAEALGLPQTAISDMLGYLQAGNSANANAINAQAERDSMFGGSMGFLGGGLGMLMSPTKPWFL